jgi:DNA-binding MarR family transcriptional regulator
VSDNLRDMYDRGRANRPRGAAHGLSKLTEEQVLEMRARYAAGGVRQQDLAEAFGVTQALVGRIVRRLIWTHI